MSRPEVGLCVAIVVLLGIALFLTYSRVWHAPFLWDDDAHLSEHPCIVGPLGFREIWTTAEANYFPLVLTHLFVLNKLFGLEPSVYHVTTLVMHALTAVLLWRVLRRLAVPGAGIGAALWAFHPVQVESVAWISEITNTQSGLLFLLGLWFGIGWLDRSENEFRWGDFIAAWLCATAAILSKPSAVMFPVALGLCAWWRRGSLRMQDVLWLAPFFLVSAAASGWAIWEQKFHSGAIGSTWDQSAAERIVLAGRSIWFYLVKLVWPSPLSFIYRRWHIAISALQWFPTLAVIGVATCLLWYRRHASVRAMLFASGFFLAMLFPVLGFFSVYYFRYSFVADHFQYLASMGPLALAGAVIAKALIARGVSTAVMGYFTVSLLIVALAVIARFRTIDFQDPDGLWSRTLARNPNCVLAMNQLAASSWAAGRVHDTIEFSERAVAIDPGYAEAQFTLGKALESDPANRARSIACFEAALRLNPSLPLVHLNLANLYARDPGRKLDAIAQYEQELHASANSAEAHSNLALLLGSMPERLTDAITHAESAVRLMPDSAEVNLNLGLLLSRVSARRSDAIEALNTAVRLKPDYVKAHLVLGGVLLSEPADVPAAVREFEAAVRYDPTSSVAQNNLGVAFSEAGRWREAVTHFEAALRIDPAYGDARNNLAALRAAHPSD